MIRREQMTSDTLERHMKQHEKKRNGIEEAGSFLSGVCGMLGKHKHIEYKLYLKTMRDDTFKRHMKTQKKHAQ